MEPAGDRTSRRAIRSDYQSNGLSQKKSQELTQRTETVLVLLGGSEHDRYRSDRLFFAEPPSQSYHTTDQSGA